MTQRSKICLALSLLIMVSFFIVQTMVVFGFMFPSYDAALFGYICIVLFTPPFICFALDFFYTIKSKKQIYDDKLSAINASSMVAIFNNKGIVISANQNFCEATGYTKEELVGMPHGNLVPRDFVRSKEYRKFWKDLNRGIFIRNKFRRRKKDGSDYWCYATYSPIRNGSGAVYQVIKIASDISEEYLAQQELQHKNVYLEHAAKILRHDMHSGINTYIPRGIKGLERRISEDQIKNLKIESSLKLIKEGLLHAQRVYKGVYEFTNLVKKDAEMETEYCKLDHILKDYLCKTAYSDQVAIGILPEVKVNEALFCTAVDNLVRNGLKYNDSEFKMVAITMEDESHIAIIDNGRGLTQDEFEILCKPYARKENQEESGTGLGLNISVAIFNEHGFDMFVSDQIEGTKILIRINDNYLSDCTLIKEIKK